MRTIIFRPTNDCNLACQYCYDINNHSDTIQNIRNRATNKLLANQDALLRGIQLLFEGEREKILIFHGGEPLLIQPDALDEFCSHLDEGVQIDIQTNGTLIDQNVIELFRKYRFRVGISLDGCNEFQNSYRLFRNGNSSFQTVMSKIKLLQDNDIRFGVIMSLSKKHIGCEQELYDFLAQHHISSNIRRVFASDQFSDTMTDQEYVDFFNRLYDIWFEDEECLVETRQIMELSSELENVLVGERTSFCSTSDDCFRRYISLDVDGNLYACNRLYGVDDFYYGNVDNISMDDLMRKMNQLLSRRIDRIQQECAGCSRIAMCNGGCPAEAYDLYHDYTRSNCDYKVKTLIRNHIKEKLHND